MDYRKQPDKSWHKTMAVRNRVQIRRLEVKLAWLQEKAREKMHQNKKAAKAWRQKRKWN